MPEEHAHKLPGLHGLNAHTFQVAHTRLRTKIHLSFSNHSFGALQRNFCRVSKVKIWFGQNSCGRISQGEMGLMGKVCTLDSAGTESARARSGKGGIRGTG